MARERDLQSWLILVFLPALGAIEWRVLSGLLDLPRTALSPFGDALGVRIAQYEWVAFFAYLLLPTLAVGVIASFVTTALGPARVRGLLSEAQCWQFGSLAALGLCIAQTGLIWAQVRQDQVGGMIWSVALAVAYQSFIVVTLMLAVRAASAVRPLQAGAQLVGAAIGTFLAAVGAGMILLLLLQDREPTLPLCGLVALVWIGLLALPPAIMTCGVAALVTGLRGQASGAPSRRVTDAQE